MGLVALLVYGTLKEGTFLGLVVLVVLAAIYPPLVIGLGLAVVLYLAVARGGLVILFNWVGGLAQTGNSPQVNSPFTPLGPTLPGYTASQTQSSYGLPKF